MSAELTAPNISYKPMQPTESPYLRARQEWDDRIGSAVAQSRNWRIACFGSLFISLLLVGGLLYQASRNKVIPMVIALDKQNGEPRIIGKANEVNYTPQLQEIKYFLGQFVQKVRAVPNDPVLIKQNWLEAYKFMRNSAAQILNDHTNKDEKSPLKRIGDNTVAVQLISVNQVGSGNSYQVRWSETIYSQSGAAQEKYTMSGVFSLEFDTSADEKTLWVNPLGIFISSFQWGKELTSGV